MSKLLFLLLIFSQSLLFGCAACQLMTPTAEVKLHIDIEQKRIKNIHADWVFTDTFISSLLMQYDTNRDYELDAKEMQNVKNALVEYLQANSMLTEVQFALDGLHNEAETLSPHFANLSLKLKENILLLSYDILLDLAPQNNSQLSLAFSDRSGFFAFVVTDVEIDSKEFSYEKNLYLFTTSILFKNAQIATQTPELKQTLPKEQEAKTPELTQTLPKEQELQSDSIQSNLLKESMQKVRSLFESIKDEKNPLTYISLLLFAYLYGLIHALGPGHGKTLVASYFLSNERSYSKALFVSLAIGVVHTFSAFLLTLIIYFGVNTFLSQFMQDSLYLTTKISAIIIIAIALYLLYTKYRAYKALKNKPKFSFSATPHQSSCACASCKVDANSTDAALIISAGIIPCPGTTTIFIFALSLGLYYAGFLAALVMSLGMSSIIYISALISVSIRKKTLHSNEKLKKYLEYGSLSIILLLGILLLLS